jgi:predicted Zn-dependent protease
MFRRGFVCAALSGALLGASEPPPPDVVSLRAMQAELTRTMSRLRLPNAEAPYYAAYWVVDEDERDVEATLGNLVSDSTTKERFVKVELRLGNRTSDNSNFVGAPGEGGDFMKDAELLSPRSAPLDDDVVALRRQLWLATDAAYKGAVETLERKRAAKQSEIAARREVPSFSADASAHVVVKEEPAPPPVDAAALAKRVSAVFRAFPEVQKSSVHVLQTATRKRFAASDGGLVVEPTHFSGIEITCEGQADDGMSLERSAFFSADKSGTLPTERALAEAKRVATELTSLRSATLVEDYSGPVLFEGKAAAQLVYELLGESLSGTPPPEGNDELESPLSRKLGKRILPRGFTVVDDPTLGALEGTPLLGHYTVDDEGIAAERVTLVEDGHLKSMLMSRAPREGLSRSNGHGRSGLVGWARGHIGNLILSSREGLTKKALRARFATEVRDEQLDFGIVVTELQTRTSSTSGEVMPAAQVAYRVTPDGRETLIRGATIAPLSVRDLRDVLASGRDAAIYSFVTENDAGTDLPASVVAPALLFEDIEIRGPSTPNKRPPVVPRPPIDPTPH